VWPALGHAFATLGESPHAPADVIADCGRIAGGSPAVDLMPQASLVLLVSRAEPEYLARVRDRSAALSAQLHGEQRGMSQLATPLIGVLLVVEAGVSAKLGHQVNDMLIAAQTGARVMGTIAHDASGAALLSGRGRGRLDRSLLIRSARKVAADIYQQFGVAWSQPHAGAGR
jgi:hypothetical protein